MPKIERTDDAKSSSANPSDLNVSSSASRFHFVDGVEAVVLDVEQLSKWIMGVP